MGIAPPTQEYSMGNIIMCFSSLLFYLFQSCSSSQILVLSSIVIADQSLRDVIQFPGTVNRVN